MMTVEEARQVPWRYNEPIGKLFSEGKLSVDQLHAASQRAWDPRLREAAETMLNHFSNAPSGEASRRFGPDVVSGSRYLEEQEQQGIVKAFLYVIASFLALLFSATVIDPLFGTLVTNLVNLFVLVPFTVLCMRQISRSFNQYISYRVGRKAEESVVEVMRSSLDASWTIFKNLRLPASRSDVDILLVSRQGLWAIEVKSYNGVFQLRNNELERRKKGRWTIERPMPASQARANAAQVYEQFKTLQTLDWVQSVLVMWEPASASKVGFGRTELWTPSNLNGILKELEGRSYLSQDDYEHVIKTLKELAVQSATR
jgi:hypothetical protein